MEDSWASSPAVRKVMQGNRSRDTRPELAVRRIIHAQGLRYFVNRRPLPDLRRTADLVFPRLKIAVFIDGCFWHGCPVHHASPKVNAVYWSAKVEGNKRRDVDTTMRLVSHGWRVLRFWGHEDPQAVAKDIQQAVERARLERGRGPMDCRIPVMMKFYDPNILLADMKAAEGVAGFVTQVRLQSSGELATIRQQGATGLFEAELGMPTSDIATEPEAFTPEGVIQKLREWEGLTEEPSA